MEQHKRIYLHTTGYFCSITSGQKTVLGTERESNQIFGLRWVLSWKKNKIKKIFYGFSQKPPQPNFEINTTGGGLITEQLQLIQSALWWMWCISNSCQFSEGILCNWLLPFTWMGVRFKYLICVSTTLRGQIPILRRYQTCNTYI